MSTNTLVVITGPTSVGKSDTAVWLARELNAEIISADSRQLYRDIPIGTAAPTAEQMAEVKHHFVGTLSLEEYYSAAQFGDDVMQLLPQLFARSPYVVMCGGSMMYVDAVCKGIDNIPTISDEIRRDLWLEETQRTLMLDYITQLNRVAQKQRRCLYIQGAKDCVQLGRFPNGDGPFFFCALFGKSGPGKE